MKVLELHGRVLALFWDKLEVRSTIAEICRRLEEGASFLHWQCNSVPEGPRQRTIFEALAAAEYRQPQELYHQALVKIDDDPCGVLDFVRECQGLKPDRFLESMKPRLTALASAPTSATGEWRCGAAEIWELDLLRRRDRPSATARLEELLKNALGRLDAVAEKPRRGIAEVCLHLFVLTAIYRLAGRRDDAMDWLFLAWALVKKTGDFKIRGYWYQRAAFLLVDLSYLTRALEFAKEAQTCFAIAGAEVERLGTLVDMAYVLTEAEKHEEARDLLEQILPQLGRADRASQISAHELLARNFQAMGDLRSAREHLAAAVEVLGDDHLARASCLWRLGKLLVEQGDSPAAISKFGEAMHLYARLTSAGELAELGMDFAGLLLKEGRRAELGKLAADLAGWIEELKGNLKLRGVVYDFKALVELGHFNAGTHRTLLAALAEAKAALRVVKHRLRAKPAKKA